MGGKALLIGAELGGLEGVGNDVAAMRTALEGRGLSVRICLKPDATRDGILEAYERFLAELEAGDPAVVFYSGYGGFVAASAAGSSAPDLIDMQFILPIDYGASTEDEFRGITAAELAHLHARLREKTNNVVVIFDCCHAADMSRRPGIRIKGWQEPQRYERVRDHIDRLRARGGLDRWRAEGTPDIVRITACSPMQSAYEHVGVDGEPIGVLTEGLTKALTEAGSEKVAWSTVADRVRRHAAALRFAQRPEIEGPARRLIFDTAEADQPASLPVTPLDDGLVRLDCTPLLGVQVGDRFAIMPPGAVEADNAAKVGDVTVGTVEPRWVEGRIDWAGPAPQSVPLGARAFPTAVTAPGITIRVPAEGPVAADLRAVLAASPVLQIIGSTESGWSAKVEIGDDGTLTVSDHSGPLGSPVPADTAGITQVASHLKTLAVAAALQRLVDTPVGIGRGRSGVFGADVDIEYGIVVRGQRRPLSEGEPVHVGDRFYASVHNRHDAPIFVSLVDIGVSGKVTLLNTRPSSGQEIKPGMSWGLGFDDRDNAWPGVPATWPDGVPAGWARPETLLVFVTSAPQDLSALGHQCRTAVRDAARQPGEAPLLDIVDQLAWYGTREFVSEHEPQVRYDVHAVRFDLDPLPRAGRFLVETRPGGSAPRATRGNAPMTLAIRLDQLMVHDNHAMFGGARVRVDIAVATGGRGGGRPSYEAHTIRFGNIRKGGTLPFDRMLMFHGRAEDFIDIAVWVTRDSAGAAELTDLLAGELASADGQHVVADILGATMPGDPNGTVATAVEAGVFVIGAAAKLLHRFGGGESIGLYRGSWLESERFGLGRHPIVGRRTVQDFSIAYTVEEAG